MKNLKEVRGKLKRKIAIAMVLSLMVGGVAPAGMAKQQVVYAAEENVKKEVCESTPVSEMVSTLTNVMASVEEETVVKTVTMEEYVNVESGTSVKLKGEGFTVEFCAESTWEGYCSFNVTLTNNGTKAMKDWSINYEQAGEITQIWSAKLGEQSGNRHTIKNVGWNESVAAGESVSFGYILQGQEIAFPADVIYTGIYEEETENTLQQGASTHVEGEGFAVDFKAEGVWEKHCVVNVTLTNTGAKAMEDWSLSYVQGGTISQIWNAEQEPGENEKCNVHGLEWNKGVEPGTSVSFGYIIEGEKLELPDDVEFTGSYVVKKAQLESGTRKTIQGNGFTVEFYVDSAWENHCSVKCTLTNTGALPMCNWALAIEQTGEIIQIWNAEIDGTDGTWYCINNFGWNQEILPGAVVRFGYVLQEENLELPSKVTYTGDYASQDTPTQGMGKKVYGDGFCVEFTVESAWNSNYTVNAVLTNTGSSVLENWMLSYALAGRLTQFWGAELISENGVDVVWKNSEWNQSIYPGKSVSFGYMVEGKNFVLPAVVNCTSEDVPSIPVEPTATPIPEATSTPTPTVTPTATPTPLVKELTLTVATQDDATVCLQWNAENIANSYEVLVDDTVVSCVSGGYFIYELPDTYEEYTYRVRSYGMENEESSKTVVYTNIKKVGGVLTENEMWGDHVGSYHVVDNLTVAEGKELYLKAGTRLRFDSDVSFLIDGTVMAAGQEGKEVVLTSFQDRKYDGYNNDFNDVGKWTGIRVGETGVFEAEYTKIYSADGGNENKFGQDITGEEFGGIEISGKAKLEMCTLDLKGDVEAIVGIKVNESGTLQLLNTNFNNAMIGIVTKTVSGDCIIDGCSINVIYNPICVNQKGDAEFCLKNSWIIGHGENLVTITSIGTEQITIENNEFFYGMYPIAIDLEGLSAEKVLIDVKNNTICETRFYGEYVHLIGNVKNEIILDGGRFIFMDDVTVEKSGKLIVNAGTEVYSYFRALEIYGEVEILGKEDNLVKISEDGARFSGIIVHPEAKLYAEYLEIGVMSGEYLQTDHFYSYAAILVMGEAEFHYSEMLNERTVGFYIAKEGNLKVSGSVITSSWLLLAVDTTEGSVEFENNTIELLHMFADVYMQGTSRLVLKGNNVEASLANYYGYLCFIEGEAATYLEITDNFISARTSVSDFWIDGVGKLEITKNTFDGNGSSSYPFAVMVSHLYMLEKFTQENEVKNYKNANGIRILPGEIKKDVRIKNGEWEFDALTIAEGTMVTVEGSTKIYIRSSICINGIIQFGGKTTDAVAVCPVSDMKYRILIGEGGVLLAHNIKFEKLDLLEFYGKKLELVDCDFGAADVLVDPAQEGSALLEKSTFLSKTRIHNSGEENISIRECSFFGEDCALEALGNNIEIVSSEISIQENSVFNKKCALKVIGSNIKIVSCMIYGGNNYGAEISSSENIVFHDNQIVNSGVASLSVSIECLTDEFREELRKNTFVGHVFENAIATYGTIDKEEIVLPKGTYMCEGIYVGKGGTLTIEPGVILLFYEGSFDVGKGGSVIARGTEDEEIVFTSIYDVRYSEPESEWIGDKVTWNGIYIEGTMDGENYGTYLGEFNRIAYAEQIFLKGL